jgi:hypothetical protein
MSWYRVPEQDKRIRNGDDFAGDAWRNYDTGEIHYVVPGVRFEEDAGEDAGSWEEYQHIKREWQKR